MRDTERQVLGLLREWHDSARLLGEVQKITRSASASGLSEAEIDLLLQSWITQYSQRRSGWIGTEAALVDLANLLNGPGNKKEKVWNRARRTAGWCIDHYVAVASMVTVLATLFYGFAYTIFFQKLGITPEQAGLNPPWFLTRSALGGLTLTLAVAVSIYIMFVPVIPLREDEGAQSESGSGKKTLLNFLLALAGMAYLTVMFIAVNSSVAGAAALAVPPVVIWLIVSFRLRKPEGGRGLNPRPLKFEFDKYLALFLVVALPLGLLVSAVVTIGDAYLYGRDASRGFAVRTPRVLGFPLLGVRVEPALIAWNGDAPRSGFPPCALYVDGADGVSFLYDHRSRRTLRLQSDVLGVAVRDGAESCDAPFNHTPPSWERTGRASVRCNPGEWRTYYAPTYRYQWIEEGIVVSPHSPHPRIFRRELPISLDRVKCRVTATNPYGTEVAVSRRVHLSEDWRRPSTGPSDAPHQGLDEGRGLG